MKYISLFTGMAKFLFYPNLSLNKILNIRRYTSLYLHMQTQKQLQIQTDINTLNQVQRQQEQQESVRHQLSQAKQNIKQRLQKLNRDKSTNMQQIKNINLEKTSKHYVKKGFQYLGLYYESLQNLVEGKRQVLHNSNYKFEDGQSVKQKQMKMQANLRKIFGEKIKQDPIQFNKIKEQKSQQK